MESAKKVGIEGAAEFLEDPNNGLKEVSSNCLFHHLFLHLLVLVSQELADSSLKYTYCCLKVESSK